MIGSALACGAALPQSSHAGGIQLYVIATPDVGLASAGYAARAQDASTVFRNPAGMSLLSGSQFRGGLQLTYGSVEFSPNSSTTTSGGNGGNAVGALPAGGLFFTHALSDRFAVGLGAFSYFGLALEYDDNWVGRYYAQKDALIGMSLMPAVSFKATDWLSIGAGLNAMYGYMNAEVAVRNRPTLVDPDPRDGQLKLKDETWGFGANAGVLIEPREGTRFGVTYLSPVSLDFEDRPSFSNLGGLGGAIFATLIGSIFASSMQLIVSINVVALIVVGGMGSIPGVIVGAIALIGTPELFSGKRNRPGRREAPAANAPPTGWPVFC